jgi:hypothetical protein
MHQSKGQRESWVGFWQGEREGISPSLLHGTSNVAEQRTDWHVRCSNRREQEALERLGSDIGRERNRK